MDLLQAVFVAGALLAYLFTAAMTASLYMIENREATPRMVALIAVLWPVSIACKVITDIAKVCRGIAKALITNRWEG